ncbi:hypothetical protein GSI_01930 [Ganoderma sinense ZZ0214-1]|uniref:Uncharacterized protein n=1 Tax=Ganoderma sinense ZZ0214-1 TaxID=1077348 RepID=A0A2G8SRR7_9APHY|nr:hypothetical protein GSI_01930 [Ganoderma sinense ZZ0214-1]
MGRVLVGRLMPAFEGAIGGENLPTAALVGAAGEELKALSDKPHAGAGRAVHRSIVRRAAAVGFTPSSRARCASLGLEGGRAGALARPAGRRVVGAPGPNMGTDAAWGTSGPDTVCFTPKGGALGRIAKLHFVAGLDSGRSRSMSARAGKGKTDEADEDGPDSPTFAFAFGRPGSVATTRSPNSEHEGEGAVRLCLNQSRFVISIGLTTGSALPRASGLAIGWRSREETARVPEDSEMKSEPARTYAGGGNG